MLGSVLEDSDIKKISWGHAMKLLFPTVFFRTYLEYYNLKCSMQIKWPQFHRMTPRNFLDIRVF